MRDRQIRFPNQARKKVLLVNKTPASLGQQLPSPGSPKAFPLFTGKLPHALPALESHQRQVVVADSRYGKLLIASSCSHLGGLSLFFYCHSQ